MAQSDVGIKLWASATGSANSFTEFLSVKDVPATGSAPSKLEITTLDMAKKGYIPDREDIPDMEFTYNYDAANFALVKAVEAVKHYFMIVYADGSGAVITGVAKTWVDAVSLGSVVTAKMNIVAESIEDKTAVEVAALTQGS
jgi:hypothetical protein